MHIAEVGMKIPDHREQVPMFVTKSEHYAIVLGIPWLHLHDIAVRFTSNTISFWSQYCMTLPQCSSNSSRSCGMTQRTSI